MNPSILFMADSFELCSFNLGEQSPFCIQTFLTVLTQQIPGHGDKNPNVSLPGDDAQQNITSLIHRIPTLQT